MTPEQRIRQLETLGTFYYIPTLVFLGTVIAVWAVYISNKNGGE